jgi:hypothetical protein
METPVSTGKWKMPAQTANPSARGSRRSPVRRHQKFQHPSRARQPGGARENAMTYKLRTYEPIERLFDYLAVLETR